MAAKRKSWLGEFWRPLAALLLWVLGMVPLIAAPPLLPSVMETRIGGLTAFPVDCIPAAPLFPSDLTRACGPPLYDLASGCSVAANRGGRFNRDSVLEGFQEHHVISDKNALTKNHNLLDLAGFDLQSRANKIFLPTSAELHPLRSIHLGKHTTSVSRNMAEQMDAVVDFGRSNSWTQSQYSDVLRTIIRQERELLMSGQRALNKNARPWAE